MKRVLIVLGKYCKQAYPNSICVSNILKSIDNKIDYDILTIEDDFNSIKDSKVFQVVENSVENSFEHLFLYPVYSFKKSKILKNKILNLYSKNRYDVIIAVTNPPETVEAVASIKKKYNNINFIIYEIDSNSNRYKNPKNLFEKYLMYRAYKWEKKVYSIADTIIHMKTHKAHYSKIFFEEFKFKTMYLDIPGFISHTNCFTSGSLKFIYAGSFYPILRDPTYMINCMTQFFNEYKVGKMDIYSNSMKETLFTLLGGNNNGRIMLHSLIPKDEIDNLMKDYEVLISVGNADSDFLPSKTLDYISSNKKIIHFYADDDDVSLPYFLKYNKCLMIKTGTKFEEVLPKIKEFIDKKIDKEYDSNLEQLFFENTPSYSGDKIVELIYKK